MDGLIAKYDLSDATIERMKELWNDAAGIQWTNSYCCDVYNTLIRIEQLFKTMMLY